MRTATEGFFVKLADIFRFATLVIREGLTPPYERKEFIRQCFEIGWKSLALTSVSGFIVGFVFVTQTRTSLDVFGGTSAMPTLLAIAVVRSLAPFSHRIGGMRTCGISNQSRSKRYAYYRTNRRDGGIGYQST